MSQIVEFVSGCFFKMIGVEHVLEGFLDGLPVFVRCLDLWIGEFLQPDSRKVFSTSLVLLSLKVEGLIEKYASMASIHLMASLDSPEKCSGRAALISEVFVVVDMGFAGDGLTGGWGGITSGCWAGGAVVVSGVTGGKGFVTGVVVWELCGRGVARFGGEGRDAGLTVYCRPRTRFEDKERSGGMLGLVGGCVSGVTARSRGFWEVLTSSGSSGTRKTFLGRWGKILGWLWWSCS